MSTALPAPMYVHVCEEQEVSVGEGSIYCAAVEEIQANTRMGRTIILWRKTIS
jgi:hypothetical protein